METFLVHLLCGPSEITSFRKKIFELMTRKLGRWNFLQCGFQGGCTSILEFLAVTNVVFFRAYLLRRYSAKK